MRLCAKIERSTPESGHHYARQTSRNSKTGRATTRRGTYLCQSQVDSREVLEPANHDRTRQIDYDRTRASIRSLLSPRAKSSAATSARPDDEQRPASVRSSSSTRVRSQVQSHAFTAQHDRTQGAESGHCRGRVQSPCNSSFSPPS
jgi:hypothetical protein